MGFFDIFRVGKIKQELEAEKAKTKKSEWARYLLKQKCEKVVAELKSKNETLTTDILSLKKQLETVERLEALGLQKAIVKMKTQKDKLQTTVDSLSTKIQNLEADVIQLDETILMQSFGIYETRYDFEDSSLYKARLDQIRKEQKQMVKDGTATTSATDWSINGSEAEGRKMIKDYVKLIVRSFNNECDATIIKAKYNNVKSLEKKINKAAETLNKLGQRMQIAITAKYINLKIQELYLSYEYELKKRAEKEEQRRIKELMREEEKVRREIEKEKKKLEKEVKHFDKALKSIDEQIETVDDEAEREKLLAEKENIQKELDKVSDDIANNDFRAKNTRAGHVYVISNIGSFGENIYKIGMTRRLIPQERVDELGDASVPYRFDVHAMIFSEDAPALESALHNAFDTKRLNFVNRRREFFNVSLDDIQQVVRENFNKPVEFTMTAAAEEYRESTQMRRALIRQAS